jgi:hypothetical protein
VQDRHANWILKDGCKYDLERMFQELIVAKFTWRIDSWLT